ncbi:MAG: SET domain-containing protein [Ferruginibacter sp.]|nr:SET domain-containing protein [Ferruginibacter sp.]
MALLEAQLIVKKSTLPGSGKGLFTRVFIPRGTRIIEYKGKITTWKDVDHQDGTNGYIYFVTKDHVIDGLPFKKELARYVNDARGITRVKGITNNCYYIEEGLKIFIESKKDIAAGGEILVDYGKEYWDVMKRNAKEF